MVPFRLTIIALCCLAASTARADRVFLKGGAVIDGKVSEADGKIVVQVESGSLSFRADEIERVERGPTQEERFEEQLAKIPPRDVAALLKLADYCRDHDQPAREREVLRKVIEADPNHAEARARLGYVHTDAGWITRDEQRRNEGLVQYQGQWVTRAQKLELEKLDAQTRVARLEREKAEVELHVREVELETKKVAAEEERAQASTRANRVYPAYGYGPYLPYYGYGFGYSSVGPGQVCRHATCRNPPRLPSRPQPEPFINGVRPPSDTSFSLPGVRNPSSYFPR
jgi:hypothetical protein